MKRAKLITILFLILIYTIPISVAAIGDGLDIVTLPNEEFDDVSSGRKFIKISSYTPLAVKCFDVRQDHMVVTGARKGNSAVIAVYDHCGNFQYGFETEGGGSFRVMWSGNNIAYYCIRSALIFIVNEDGDIKSISCVANTRENSIYDQKVLLSTKREVDGITYYMTNENILTDIFTASFAKIKKTDPKGTFVIYDASENQVFRIIGGICIYILISSVIASGAILGTKRWKASKRLS